MSDLLNQASLVMVPSGYKEDTVYSVVPTNGSGDLSFTRASNGTRINSAGLVEVVPWNLLQYSEDFSNAAWTKSNSPTMTYNSAIAPNGTMTADGIQDTSGGLYKSVYQIITSIAPNSTLTFSIYVKKETSETNYGGISMYFSGATAKVIYGIFNAVNGTINFASSSLTPTCQIVDTGNYWRIELTATDTGANTQILCEYYATMSTNGTSLGTGVGSARTIWGAQLNIGSTAKPYFPTTDRLNVPRLTYQNGGGGCPSLLLEKQSTNIALYSQDWELNTNGYSGGAFSANQTNSPDGTQNADKYTVNSSTSTHGGFFASTGTASATYAVSAFIKAGTGRYFLFRAMTDSFATRYGVTIDLQTGTILGSNTQGTPTGTSYKIEDYGNGWYRVVLTMNTIGTQIAGVWGASNTGTPSLQTDLDYSYTGNGTDSYYMWGMQIEQSSYPTSYIPTTSSSATRVADACFKTGISSLIGQTEGVIFADFVWEGSTTGGADYPLSIYASSYSDFVGLNTYENTNSMYVYVGGSNVVAIAGTTFVNGQRYKIAMAYKSNDFVYYLNGTQMGADTSGSVPSSMANFQTVTPFAGKSTSQKYNEIIFFPTRLTNAELASLTTL